MQLILLGPPGSGKGTLAADLEKIYQVPHISTGDIFRGMIQAKTELGVKAESYISKGSLVPDEITIKMVQVRLRGDDCGAGFLLDGFPRTIVQAEALDNILQEQGRSLSAVLNVVVEEDLILYRLTGRRHCPQCGRSYNINTMPPENDELCDDCHVKLVQRADDNPETIRERLRTYNRQTLPLIEFYRDKGMIVNVDNSGKPGENLDTVKKLINDKVEENRER